MPKVVYERGELVAVLYSEADDGGTRAEIYRRGKEHEVGGCLRVSLDEVPILMAAVATANYEMHPRSLMWPGD